jgi:hypothetical protein
MTAEDLGYGFERGFLKPADVIALATHELRCRTDELLDDPKRVHDPRESARKWLYLELKAAYDERERLDDPLSVVEEIYSDFDYPPTAAPFVRYMPLRPGDDPGVGPLMERWAD